MRAYVCDDTDRVLKMHEHEREVKDLYAGLEHRIEARHGLSQLLELGPSSMHDETRQRIAGMVMQEEQIREQFEGLGAVVSARIRLQLDIASSLENMHGTMLLEEERTARHYFSTHFPMFTIEATSRLFDLVSNPPILVRGGSWYDEAEYFEQYIEDFRWVETIWAYILYRTSRYDLENMLQEGWEADADPDAKAAIQSWVGYEFPHRRPGWIQTSNFDGGLSGFFN